MSLRRPFLALGLGSVALAGLGLRDWPVDPAWATALAARALGGYGLALAAQGPASLTVLPTPRLVLARARLAVAGPAGPVLAEGGRLAVEFDALGLLAGRASVGGLGLDGARLSPDAAAWAAPLARLLERIGGDAGGHPRRISLTGAALGDGAQARDLDVDLGWPVWSAAAEARASLTWRGVPARVALTRVRPAELARDGRTPFALAADWPGGSLAADGAMGPRPDGAGLPAVAGRARFETRSLPETLAWLSGDAPLSALAGAFSLDGDVDAGGRSVAWPHVRVGVGSNLLEGAGSLALGTGAAPRLSAQATLAADALNLAPLFGALVRLFEAEPVPLGLAPLTGGDLDLRLSAAVSRIGPVQVEDLAASVLVREAAVEVALNRARVQDGTLKGRLALARAPARSPEAPATRSPTRSLARSPTSGADPDETEVRVQGTFDRVDLGGVMGHVGEARWVQGPAQGQFALEGAARDMAGLLARVSGRAALSIDGGAISGLDLADVLHRNGAVAPGALARRNGRTGFERAWIALRFSGGVGEIAEAAVRGAGVGATLHGQVSLPERRIDAVAELSPHPPADPSRAVAFEISGPWDAPTVRPAAHGEPAEPAARPPDGAASPRPPAPGLPGTVGAYAP